MRAPCRDASGQGWGYAAVIVMAPRSETSDTGLSHAGKI